MDVQLVNFTDNLFDTVFVIFEKEVRSIGVGLKLPVCQADGG
jgi:hypothetical protein